MEHKCFPFAAVEGQDGVKKALLWNAVNPLIGGVLISGEKGTAKSTMVRGLAALLPGMRVVELPLNVTEDRLVGTIDLERAIKEGKKSFDPGILALADGNILYVDEVNLLSDHIVNCLLEVSASGVNRVEREGISYSHPSRFILAGTMNPEEGMLRPQLLDRFGLYVAVEGLTDPALRTQVIRRRLEYERDPAGFLEQWRAKGAQLTARITMARSRLEQVRVDDHLLKLAAEMAARQNCAGHRAEITIVEASRAIAALDNRDFVIVEDLREAALFALPHRVRERNQTDIRVEEQQEDPPEQPDETPPDNREEETPPEQDQGEQEESGENTQAENDGAQSGEQEQQQADTGSRENVAEPGEIFTVKPLEIKPPDKRKRKGSGKRSKTVTDSAQGKYVRYCFPKGKLHDIALDATIRAAAPFQRQRSGDGLALSISRSDFREKVRERRTGSTILFVVDASGSMGANQRMRAVKGAVLSLLNDAYQKRDKVGMLSFRKKEAELLLGVTRSVDLAQKKLRDLPTGGKTPLAAGLYKGYELVKAVMLKDPQTIPLMIVVSDGRANVALGGGNPVDDALYLAGKIAAERIKCLVIDTEKGYLRMGLAGKLAAAMNADYRELDELKAEQIAYSVKNLAR